MGKSRIWRRALVIMIFYGALIAALQQLLTPKYMEEIFEGALIAEYYAAEKDHDVLFIGDCEVYENFSPITLFEEFGLTSYIRGGPQQLIWQSYYLLEDTLRYEKPDIVVFNVLAMQYGEPQSEAYNRLNLDGMALSPAKVKAVLASMLPEESFWSYFLPLLRYHDRWRELAPEDFAFFFQRAAASHNGFMMRSDVKPVGRIPAGAMLEDYALAPVCFDYLDRMRELCGASGMELVLIKAPTIWPHWYPEWDRQIRDYAERYGLLYINFLDNMENIGLDLAVDTYDAGLHLNLAGAEKLTRYFGAALRARGDWPDRRADPALRAVWAEKARRYEEHRAAQLREIEEYGQVRSFRVP
ncbi:MAG: SGNH/GDSL hydrolase family protein [Gracilibacteraceae bacterium]|nr:SGNH/GDSL hydrolase family protein [Gracilibacteraceae bacterium]